MIFTVTAGHGANDPGNTWNGHREAALMLELRHIVALKLREHGHGVREDGVRGVNWGLNDALKLINGSNLALELHTNAAGPTATGVEVVSQLQHRTVSQRLAHAIGSVLQIPSRRDRGWVSHTQLSGERGFQPGFTRRGGIIVEVFFQSNKRDLATYLERKWLVASAIASVLHQYSQEPT